MTKYYANGFGAMLVGEESILRRLHLDTSFSDTREEAVAKRESFLRMKMESLREQLDRLSTGLPLYRMDEQNRFIRLPDEDQAASPR